MDPAVLGLALVAGAVAAFNPCGFALLPAYLTMLVARAPAVAAGGDQRAAATVRALRFTAGMTVGFVGVFGAFGLLVASFALSIERWLPVVTVMVGLALVVLGVWLLAGRSIAVPALRRAGGAPSTSWRSQVGYGVTFALVSLSCTVGPFLAVTTGALRTRSLVGVVSAFTAYALGMGAVVGLLAVAAATASASLTARLRRASPLISRLSGVLLLVAGAYVAWYGWFELRILAGGPVDDPVVAAAVEVQGWLTRAVAGLGVAGITGAALLLVAVAVAALLVRRARRADGDRTSATSVTRG